MALRERVQALLDAVETARSANGPTPRLQPTFLVHGDGEERVPIDARVFLKYPDAPDDFLGVQFQVAVNLVQGTNYPYFYAVIVARPGFGLLDRSGAIERAADGLTVETDREDDAEVVVIRQTTTKNSGYHTNARAVRGIAAAAVAAAAALLGSPTRP